MKDIQMILNKWFRKEKEDSTQTPSNRIIPSLDKELEMAKKVQQGLLAANTIKKPNINVAKRCIAANHLGGDFYCIVEKSDPIIQSASQQTGVIKFEHETKKSINFFIGDVAGHGLSSALVMSLCSGIFPKIANDCTSPGECLSQLNNRIMPYLNQSSVKYLTGFCAQFDLDTKTLSYAKGGHPPALIMHKNGKISELKTDGIFLGMYEDEHFEEKSIQLSPQDKLVLFTDGIPETRNNNGTFFGQESFLKLLKF